MLLCVSININISERTLQFWQCFKKEHLDTVRVSRSQKRGIYSEYIRFYVVFRNGIK